MKKGICLIFLILLISFVSAQDDYYIETGEGLAETVENKLSIEFHAVTGTDVVTLDLPRYFGKDAEFVHNDPEHVEVIIDPDTHVATLRTKDPEWRGTETVIFATSSEYLEEEVEGSILLPPRRNVTLVKINVTKEDIAKSTDTFTQQQFETVVGNLTSEPIDISTFVGNKSLAMLINEQVLFNISLDGGKPRFGLSWRIKPSANMSVARYGERSDIITFTVIIFFILAFFVLVIYVYYGYSDSIKKIVFAPKKKKKDVSGIVSAKKKEALSKLRSVERKIGKEKPGKLYRECISVMNKFLAGALGIRGSDIEKINAKLIKQEIPRGLIAKIESFITNQKTRVYSKEKITPETVTALISSLRAIIEKL